MRRLKLHHPASGKRTTNCDDPAYEHGFTATEELDRTCPHCGAALRVEDCGEGRWAPRAADRTPPEAEK